MNSGIPDTLLEGLGFFRNNEMDNEDCDGSEIGAYSNDVPREILSRPNSKSTDGGGLQQQLFKLTNPLTAVFTLAAAKPMKLRDFVGLPIAIG
jgi:hypothetical protein